MSVSCPPSRPSAQAVRGFTLLELLIVLALISMVAAMVVPRLQGTYDAVVRSGDRAEALRQVERLPLIARDHGRAIVIPAGDPAAIAQLLSLPGGWQASAVEPMRIEANGLCHGAELRMAGDGAVETWTLAAPDCSVADAP
jgi:prepilin-type N-terminal cleavage/methylation domain-containing protein